MHPPSDVLDPLASGGRFCFACHPGVSCFTDCCRDLDLMLTPYDVLRLKRALALDSTDLLDRYTLRVSDPQWKIPALKLRMGEGTSGACPFVQPDGCRVYPDRPGACRAYPVARAARTTQGRAAASAVQEKHFLVREPHCRGFGQGPAWTAQGWMTDQGLDAYNEMNDLWMRFLTRYRPGTGRELSPKQWQMFFMACYSLDRFREFVFGTRFLSLFDISGDRVKALQEREEALLVFALEWLAFSLFNEPVLSLKRTE